MAITGPTKTFHTSPTAWIWNDTLFNSEVIGTVSPTFVMRGTTNVRAGYLTVADANTAFEIELEISPNGTDWFTFAQAGSSLLFGEAALMSPTVVIGAPFCRFITTVGEASASTVDLWLFAW